MGCFTLTLNFFSYILARIVVSLRTQVQLQIILDPDYLLVYLSVSYDYDQIFLIYKHICFLILKSMTKNLLKSQIEVFFQENVSVVKILDITCEGVHFYSTLIKYDRGAKGFTVWKCLNWMVALAIKMT